MHLLDASAALAFVKDWLGHANIPHTTKPHVTPVYAPPVAAPTAVCLPGGKRVQGAPHGTGILLPNRIWHDDGQRDPGRTKGRDVLSAALCRSNRQQRIEHAVRETRRPSVVIPSGHGLPHPFGLIDKPTGVQETVVKRQCGIKDHALAGGLSGRADVLRACLKSIKQQVV